MNCLFQIYSDYSHFISNKNVAFIPFHPHFISFMHNFLHREISCSFQYGSLENNAASKMQWDCFITITQSYKLDNKMQDINPDHLLSKIRLFYNLPKSISLIVS